MNAKRQWSKAAEAYRKALAIDSTLAATWVQLGHCEKEAGNRTAAEDAYRTASKLSTDGDADFHLAYLLRDRGDKAGAFEAFRRNFEATSNPVTADELSDLIGTTTPWSDVADAIEGLFDPAYYLERNQDVAAANADPVLHYLLFGWKEGRVPSRLFDPQFYAERFARYMRKRDMPLAHFAKHGKTLGLRSNPVGDTIWFEPKAPEASAWDAVLPARSSGAERAVVILPVYKGYDETLAAVYHALASRGSSAYSLLVINDCGPDTALNNELAALSGKGLFDYQYASVNRGFVRTVNHALKRLSGTKDVVLLNSDAFVFPGWFDRLIAHADADPAVATVTPLSNNATLCSYPVIDRDNPLAIELDPAALDALTARVNKGFATETPTGVGFCFYMRRSVIDEIGPLDEVAFKVGYGEENDFCMRALNAGFKNLIAADVFVYHVGSVSFSSIKSFNFDEGQKALIGKHPNYSQLTSRYVSVDPGWEARLKLDMARLRKELQDGVVFVTHRWSGGIETYLADLIARMAPGTPYVLLRVHDRHYASIETDARSGIYVPNLSGLDLRVYTDVVRQLLDPSVVRSIHVNSFAGLDWAHHRLMLEVIGESGIPYTYVGHDYSPISHHYELLSPTGIHRGLPTPQEVASWTGGRFDQRPDRCPFAERQAVYGRFLSGAARLEAPSHAAASMFRRFFPDVAFAVVPHADHLQDVRPIESRRLDGRLKIAFLGALGPHKGSDVILAMAKDIKARGLNVDLSIVGYSNQDEPLLANGVSITGAYSNEFEAVELLTALQPDLLFIPSIWPETYCYTLSVAIALGIPPVVFDLGAQAERVRALGWGEILDPMLINAPSLLVDRLFEIDLNEVWRSRTSR